MIYTNSLGQRLDLSAAVYVSGMVTAVNRECWANSIRALRRCYRRDPSARYVEGMAVYYQGWPVEHGWLEVGDTIVDPTPAWLPANHTERRRANLPKYYPVVRFRLEDLRGLQIPETPLPLVYESDRVTAIQREQYVDTLNEVVLKGEPPGPRCDRKAGCLRMQDHGGAHVLP